MKPLYTVVALLVLVVCEPTALARKWTDNTGKYTVEAELVDFKDCKVRLKKESGTIVAIPFERLSSADQEWVKQQGGLEIKFVSSGTTARLFRYTPLSAELDAGAESIKKAPEGLATPKYGALKIDQKSWSVVLDEPQGKPAKLFVDTNGDGDMTNDAAATWTARTTGGGRTAYHGNAQVDLGGDTLGTVEMYRNGKTALKNTLMYYADFGYEVSLDLDGKTFSFLVAGEPQATSRFWSDRDGNGRPSYKLETVSVGKPFNFTGTTYLLSLTEGELKLDKAAEALPVTPMPPNLAIGRPALPFSMVATDGTKIDFPQMYAGKLVMLDFWATWCGPCIAELPNVKNAHRRWHDKGFEIIGISCDVEGMAEKLKTFTTEKKMPWPQIYEGKELNATLAYQYDVNGIPFALLIDGDTGEILANDRDLSGPGLSEFIGKQLAKKKDNLNKTPVGRQSSTAEPERSSAQMQARPQNTDSIAKGGNTPSAKTEASPNADANIRLKFDEPAGMQVAWDLDGLGTFESKPIVVPGQIDVSGGRVYRLKISNIEGRDGMESYPTLEIMPLTSESAVCVAHNPIPVQFSDEDFDHIMAGNLVCKVMYLPHAGLRPRDNVDVPVVTLVSSQLSAGQDPVLEATRLGSILAVLRIGNISLRVPGMDGLPLKKPMAAQVLFARPNSMTVYFDVGNVGKFDSEPLVVPGRINFATAGMFRLKISNIEGHEGLELFPTLEIAPANVQSASLVSNIAMPVRLTPELLDQVLAGNPVTLVLYLPDPEFRKAGWAGIAELVGSSPDMVEQADRLGSIIVTVRIDKRSDRDSGR